MSEHPHSKTFPGRARIVSPGPKLLSGKPEFPAQVERVCNPETGRFQGTRVTVPAGADMQYSERKRTDGSMEYDVSVVRFEAAKPIDMNEKVVLEEPSPVNELEEPETVYREDEDAPKR